ncbi:MAG: MFS transporter [Pseudomonadota bacterium]
MNKPLHETRKGSALLVFTLCFLAGLCEGYDLLVAGIAAPKFAPVFGLDPAQLGGVFSASTLGLFVGAIVGGRLADHIGRRAVTIGSLVLLGVFSIATTWAGDTASLLALRFLTGLGLGGTLPNILALTNEFGNPKNASMRVTMLGSAMPFGGGIVAALSAARPDLDWQTVFHIGGYAPLAVAVLMFFALPESPAFRAAKAGGAQSNITVTLAGDNRLGPSLLIWSSAFFTALALYMLINWLPSLLVSKGFTKPDASKAIMLLTLGGAASGFVFGALSRLKARALLYIGTWIGMAISVVGMASSGNDVRQAFAASFGIGFFISGGQFLLYALATEIYPPRVRGTGVGFMVGIGRLGAVAGPLLAGVLLMAGRDTSTVMLAVVPLIFVALAAALPLLRNRAEAAPGATSDRPLPAN